MNSIRILAGLAILPVLFWRTGGALAQPEKPPANGKAMELFLQKAEDEYRLFYKKPQTVPEFWAAMQFEIGVGKLDLAALLLKGLLEKQPPGEVDKELLKIQEAKGMSAFLRLQTIRKWTNIPAFQKETEKNVETLINRVTAALDKYLSDPARITKFISRLDAPTVEERAYSFVQLDRSKARAAHYLVKALQENVEQPLYPKIVEAIVRLDADVVPGFIEVLKARSAKDASAPDLRLTLLDILKRRGELRAVPYLWHLSASRKYPPEVRARARAVLSYLLNTDPLDLPPPAQALTELAERYYQRKVKFPDPRNIPVWPWDGQSLAVQPVKLTAPQAEEYFGLRYARESLELDPAYQPAQMAFLDLTLSYTYAGEADQFFFKKMPAEVQQLLATIDADLLARALERGLKEGNLNVILPIIQVLGERGEVRAARSPSVGERGVLLQALNYGDRRVQYAAVRALLRMPGIPVPVVSTRLVDILRRFLAAGTEPRALVAFPLPDKAADIRKAVKAAGFEPVLVKNIKEAFRELNQAADFDVILLFPSLPRGELPYVLTQLRTDKDSGLLPLLVLAGPKERERLPRLLSRYPKTWIVSEIFLTMPGDLKGEMDKAVKEAGGAKLSAKERQEFSRVSMDWLWRMAREEIRGYNIRPALDPILKAVESKDLAVQAVEIMGRLPGSGIQQRLGAIMLDKTRGKLRLTAAFELNRHIQRHGLVLTRQQVKDLKAAYQDPSVDAELRAQMALMIGSLRSSVQQTGTRLIQFEPGGAGKK